MSNQFIATLACLVLTFGGGHLFAQQQDDGTIFLTNPSFEDMARHSHAPLGWADCGFPGESAPDIQPDPMGLFQVSKPAFHGSTYLGMVVRDNDTWERVSQKLSKPMQGGQCYEFRLHLARSEMYVSQTRSSGREQNYVTPAVLRIYGGYNNCDRQVMLAESSPVINYRWIEYRFKLKPDENYSHIVLEAFYNTPTLLPYNGNVLIDNASPLEPVSCEEELVFTEPTPSPREEPTTRPRQPNRPSVPAPVIPADAPEAILAGIPYSKMEVGDYVRLTGVRFAANSYEFEPDSDEALEELYDFLVRHQDVKMEIGGHTNAYAGDNTAEALSKNRAMSVASYLVKRGIPAHRLQTKGYGKSRQIDTGKSVQAQRINQRVEVRITEKG